MNSVLKIAGKKRIVSSTATAGASEKMEVWTFTHRPGGWILGQSSTGRRTKLMLQLGHEGGRGTFTASVSGTLWHGEWTQPDESSTAAAEESQDSKLVAQFPGKVRKLLVEKGLSVKAGDPLLLIEAMKMEFTIRAPYSGKIEKVFVGEGQQLSPGDRLIDMEELTDAAQTSSDI